MTDSSEGMRHQLRLVGSAGSNKVMAGELSRLVRRAYDDIRVPVPKKEGAEGLSYPFDARMAATAVRFHRTSARVLWELYRLPATRLEPLYAELTSLVRQDSRDWLDGARRISVQAFGVQDFAAGSRQVVGTVKNALVAGAEARGFQLTVDGETPELQFDVRLVDGQVSVSLDLAGRPMHQRGYRQASGVAPLREDLAALLVMLTRHDSRREILIDPMAGAGTIPIEAACLAKARYNWSSGRAPLCSGMKTFEAAFSQHRKALFGDTEPLVIARDLEPDVVDLARRNLDTAGVSGSCELSCGDFRALTPDGVAALARERGFGGAAASDASRRSGVAEGLSLMPGVILCNPPYGERLAPQDLNELYADLRHWALQFKGWRAGFLVANPDFESHFRLRPVVKKPLYNGPLKAMFYLYQL